MDCLEFKRLALSDPSNTQPSFIRHSENCPDCLRYVGEVRQNDADLKRSLDVDLPSELGARLHLNSEVENGFQLGTRGGFAIAAGLALALVFGLWQLGSRLGPQPGELAGDYEKLLVAVVEHINRQGITPVWEANIANREVKTLLASYDSTLQFSNIDTLQFGRICPMGRYRGLHASIESGDGQTTFAYIKGEPVGRILDATYEGYIARVKPVKGGNVVIVSRTRRSVDAADSKIEQALVWDI